MTASQAERDVAFGSTLFIIDVPRLRPADVLAQLAAFAPTDMAIPAQLARTLPQVPERSVVRLPSVRRLGIGSEGFRYEDLAGLLAIYEPDVVIGHNLATTEAGRIMHHEFVLVEAPSSGVMRIGTPVFPDRIRLVPAEGLTEDDDEVFEVHVGGAIATGYLHDPELTARRFLQDPEGPRWWTSGDVVSRDANGMYRHRGRVDDIVKVRGKLASPSDVSAVLLSIDGVRSAITIPDVVAGNTRLESHVELEPGSTLMREEVREVLSARLAAHRVPSAVMRHAHLPINARGKLDRHALSEGPFEPWGTDV